MPALARHMSMVGICGSVTEKIIRWRALEVFYKVEYKDGTKYPAAQEQYEVYDYNSGTDDTIRALKEHIVEDHQKAKTVTHLNQFERKVMIGAHGSGALKTDINDSDRLTPKQYYHFHVTVNP
jgi:purine nucleoside phosphorylase